MKSAYGYIRVSKDLHQDKVSPEAQRNRIRDECRRKRWQLAAIAEDLNVPGAGVNRPGWDELMVKVGRGDVIVCNEFTRIGRNLRETLARIEELHERGVEIVSLEGDLDTTTAAGKLQYQVLLVLAEFERNRMSERLQQAHEQIAREGRWKGGGTPPLGYSYTPGARKLEVIPEEAAIVREIYELRDRGWGYMAIAKDLDARGIRGKHGRMSYSSIKQTLNNATYAGKRVHLGNVYEGLHEAIVSEDLWERVQARNREASRKGHTAGRRLLSGLMYCGDCGCKMVYWSGKGTGRQTIHCKESREFKTGRLVTIEAHLAEGWVLERFLARLDEKRLRAAEERARKRAPKRQSRAQVLRRQFDQVEASLDRLVSDYYDHDEPMLGPEQFRKKNAELALRKAAIAAELQAVADEARLDNVVYLQRARTYREKWAGLTIEEKREALRLFVDRIVVHPRADGRPKVDPERMKIVWK